MRWLLTAYFLLSALGLGMVALGARADRRAAAARQTAGAEGRNMKRTREHDLLVRQIVKSMRLVDALIEADPCAATMDARGLLRAAYESVSDRAAALRVRRRIREPRAAEPAATDVLRGMQAARARQPRRRSALLRLLGGEDGR